MFIISAYYFGENIEWLTSCIATIATPKYSWTLFTFSSLFPRAVQAHKWYKTEFKGEYSLCSFVTIYRGLSIGNKNCLVQYTAVYVNLDCTDGEIGEHDAAIIAQLGITREFCHFCYLHHIYYIYNVGY